MYLKNKKSFIFVLVVLCLIRTAMKLLFIDIDTGFYNSAPIFPLLEKVFFIVAAGTFSLLLFKIKDDGIVELIASKKMNKVFLVYGILVLTNVCLKTMTVLTAKSYSVNSIPKPLLTIELIAGTVAALSMISSALMNIDARLLLTVPLWHSLFAIDRFITFKQVSTVSDQTLETLFWVFSILFWSQAIDFLGKENPNRKNTILFGVESLIVGTPLLAGQLFSLFVFKNVSGPTFESIIIMIGDCIFISSFIKELIYSQKKF